MPQAIPFIVGAAATAAVPAGFALLELSAAATASIIGGAASLVATVAMSSMQSKPAPAASFAALTQPGAGRSQQFRQPTQVHQAVVGRIKKSGPWAYEESFPDDTGRADGYQYTVHVIAGHHCKRVGDIYIDQTLSTDAKFDGLFRFSKYLGTADQIADPDFVAETGGQWTANHRGRGRALLYSRYKVSAAAVPNGFPNYQVMVWGTDEVYDPRTLQTGWTNNAILLVAWWMMWGEGYSIEDFHLPSLRAAASVCDERVRVFVHTTTFTVDADTDYCTLSARSRALDVGDGVRVSSTGDVPGGLAAHTTYYAYPGDDEKIKLCTTVANAFEGIGVDITDAGSGTLTLTYWDEARYKANGMIELDVEKIETRRQLLTACAGFAVEIGDLFYLHAGAAAVLHETPLTDNDLRGTQVTTPKRSMRDRCNGMRAVFVDPDNNWQPGDAPPILVPEYLAQDNGIPLYRDMRAPFTLSARCMCRLMKIEVGRNRCQREVFFPAKMTAVPLRPLDAVPLENEIYEDIFGDQHLITGWALVPNVGVDLQMREDRADIYDWHPSEERTLNALPGVNSPDPSAIATPESIVVDTPILPVYSRLNATINEVRSIWAAGYDVEFRASDVLTWSSAGRVETNLISLVMEEAVDIRARAATHSGAASDWCTNLAPGTPTDVSVDGTDITWTNGSGAALVQIFQGGGAYEAATLFATEDATTSPQTVGVATGYYYWLRSVNEDGNVSGHTEAVTVGSPAGTASDGSDGGSSDGDGDDGAGDGGGDA